MMKSKKSSKSPCSPTALVPYLPTQCEHRVHRKKGTSSIFSLWKKRIVKVKANILLIYKCHGDQKTISREHEEMYEEAIALHGFVVKVEPNITGKSEKHQVISLSNPLFPQKRYHFSVGASAVQSLTRHIVAACSNVDITHFKIIRPIGSGTYGEVVLVQHTQTNEMLAMKMMTKEVSGLRKEDRCPALMKHVIQERAGLEHGRECPYIVQLRYAFQDETRWYLVMEYLQGGELFSFRMKQPDGCFPQSIVCAWAAQLVTAIQLLHKRGIVHRDLKLENLLLDSQLHIRLTDFGLCKNLDVWSAKNPQLEPPQIVTVNSPAELFASSTTDGGSLTAGSTRSVGGPSVGDERARPPPMGHPRSYSFCGTNDYIAPEMIISALRPGQTYGFEIDWWALGIVLYELLVGDSPFKAPETMQLYTKILQQPVEWPPGIKLTADCKDLVEGLLSKHPSRRLGRAIRGFEEQDDTLIRKHPFFKDINWDLVTSGNMSPLTLRVRSGLALPPQDSKHSSLNLNSNTSVIHTPIQKANEEDEKHWEVRLDGYAYVGRPSGREESHASRSHTSQRSFSTSTPSTILGALSLTNNPPVNRHPAITVTDRGSISVSPSNFDTSPEVSCQNHIVTSNELLHPPHISEPEILQAQPVTKED